MTEAEIFEFDLNGYIMYRNVLTRDQVDHMNGILDQHLTDDSFNFRFLHLDPMFMEVMALPRTLNVLETIIGKWMRLDHAYGLQMDTRSEERGDTRPNLHGGPLEDNGEHHYQWFNGKMYNGLTVVMYALRDVNPGDGGFICVPGSHKTNLDFKPAVESHFVVNPTFEAGDMLIFTEALIHGTNTWTSADKRRSLLYKYSPGHSTWAIPENWEKLQALAANDLQRDLLRAPSIEGRTPVEIPEA